MDGWMWGGVAFLLCRHLMCTPTSIRAQQLPALAFTMEGGAVISLSADQYTVEFHIPEVRAEKSLF